MIVPKQLQTTQDVAAHYDELDSFYREIWGEHVHHGYWATRGNGAGRASADGAVVALIELVADRLRLRPGLRVCDIGCGYGATARYLAERFAVDVTGVTVSAAQADIAQSGLAASAVKSGEVSIQLQDWLANSFPASSFDRIYAVESSEHMVDKQRFFDETFRTIRPNGIFVVCAWLARFQSKPWEVRYLLEPICREGRLPGLGDEADYQRFAEQSGFRVVQVEDLSDQVSRTWWICIRRGLGRLLTRPRYLRYLLNGKATDRSFVVTLFRIMMAYRTRSMRYCVFVFRRDDG